MISLHEFIVNRMASSRVTDVGKRCQENRARVVYDITASFCRKNWRWKQSEKPNNRSLTKIINKVIRISPLPDIVVIANYTRKIKYS